MTTEDKKTANTAAPLAAADLVSDDFWAEVQQHLAQSEQAVQPRQTPAAK